MECHMPSSSSFVAVTLPSADFRSHWTPWDWNVALTKLTNLIWTLEFLSLLSDCVHFLTAPSTHCPSFNWKPSGKVRRYLRPNSQTHSRGALEPLQCFLSSLCSTHVPLSETPKTGTIRAEGFMGDMDLLSAHRKASPLTSWTWEFGGSSM